MLTETAIKKVLGRIAQSGVEKAPECFQECLKFFKLCVAYPGEFFVPSAKVDEAWHEFVLCTREYTEHCAQEYGSYIHHDPCDEPDLKGYQRTRDALKAEFGEIDESFWPPLEAGACTGTCKTLLVAGSCTGTCQSGTCKPFF